MQSWVRKAQLGKECRVGVRKAQLGKQCRVGVRKAQLGKRCRVGLRIFAQFCKECRFQNRWLCIVNIQFHSLFFISR